jgi:CHRD domain-containing protein
MNRTIYSFCVAGLMLVGLAVSPAAAQSFKADMKTSEEVPPVTGGGSGKLEATYDAASKKLTWKGTYSGLSGPVTAAHFHGPVRRLRDLDGRAGYRSGGRQALFQYPHSRQSGRRDSRTSAEGQLKRRASGPKPSETPVPLGAYEP